MDDSTYTHVYIYVYIQRVKRLTCKLVFTSAFPSYPIQLISINVHKLPLRNRNSRLLRSLSKEPKFHSIKVLIKVVACKEVPHAGGGGGKGDGISIRFQLNLTRASPESFQLFARYLIAPVVLFQRESRRAINFSRLLVSRG